MRVAHRAPRTVATHAGHIMRREACAAYAGRIMRSEACTAYAGRIMRREACAAYAGRIMPWFVRVACYDVLFAYGMKKRFPDMHSY